MPAAAAADSSLSVPELQRQVDELAAELRARTADHEEAVQREAAVAEILQVINSSSGNLALVLDALLEKATNLCEAAFGILWTYDGENFRAAAFRKVPTAYAEYLRESPPLGPEDALGRIAAGESLAHVPDMAVQPFGRSPLMRHAVELGDFRTLLGVALRKEGTLLGAITVYRQEVRLFSDKQVALLESFAAQAVIAMENTRLLGELREALDQQTANAEVLQVINSSPGNLAPVFDAILEKAHSLCDAPCGSLQLYDGSMFRAVADRGLPETLVTLLRQGVVARQFREPDPDPVHVNMVDAYAASPNDPVLRAVVKDAGLRTVLFVPLHKEGIYLGRIVASRRDIRPFTDKQVTVLQNFAAQAVIAMENARLLTEQREALEQQTATAEVLEVINVSPGELRPVFDAMLEKAMYLCEAVYGLLWTYDGECYRAAAMRGLPEGCAIAFRDPVRQPHPEVGLGRILRGERLVINTDMAAEVAYREGDPIRRAMVDIGGARSCVQVALRKDDVLLGAFVIYRKEIRPFTDQQVALVQNFAAQAVIAIENARLLSELRQRTDDVQESLEYQTATSEVLEVIGRSTSDLQPVLDTMLAAALRLCNVQSGGVAVRRGDTLHYIAAAGHTPEFRQFLQNHAFPINHSNAGGRAVLTGTTVHIPDVETEPGYSVPQTVQLGRKRAMLSVPLMRQGDAVGVITLSRAEPRPFTERQIGLIETFADQAVIAMENARLLSELRASLEQQTATSDVLKTISRSSVGLEAVLHTLVETVSRLCRADLAYMFRQEDELYHLVAAHGLSEEARAFVLAHPIAAEDRRTVSGRVAVERRTVHIADVLEDPGYSYGGQQSAGYRTMLGIPLLRESTLIGIFNVARTRVEPFTPKEIELAVSFADQAVIAIENARLFDELRDRQAELRVTFDNMGDGVAMFDAEPRLAAWNRNFEEIIGLPDALLAERPSYADYLRLLAERGEFGTENVEAELASRLENTDRELRLERTRADGTVIEVRRNAVPGGGFVLIYSDVTEQRRAEAAIRAARDDAEAALERQTATADILKVIASSPTDVQPVLEAVAKAAVRFCSATDAMIQMREGDSVISTVHEGPLTYSAGVRRSLDRTTAGGRSIVDAQTCHLPDVEAGDAAEFVTARKLAAQHGFRASVAAPLKREGTAIGAVVLRKVEPGPFTPQQIQLLETFAAQAVIAIENVRLFTELRDSLERLKAVQANLIQSEKMASLGQLTAGIAHEIKNPLNFVNNFAGLSVELLDELKQAAAPVLTVLDADQRAEVEETIGLLTSNLERIAEHGKRADGIVKSMLSHSRGGTGDWQESNINALVEEALNLAYHGARAQDGDFNVTLERDFAPEAKLIDVVPQDVTRVFLNLFGNGFYATRKRHRGGADAGYRPTLRVSTRDLGEAVEVRVRDNGTGIQPEVRTKLFQPFFTTKPTGEGTGLGLSISYDIVTQQHGGSIDVESEPGSFTEFTVRLPRRRRAA